MADARRVRIVVRGQVQGVGFRWSTADEADAQGVSGWVRNLPDGSVEAELEGTELDAMLDWLRTGPPFSRVDAVETTDVRPTGEVGFRIR